MSRLHEWRSPAPESIPADLEEFLFSLPGPTHIYLPGRDRSRCRVVVTLLHGNEPSGLVAVHALLRQGVEPAIDLHLFIANVEAARSGRLFAHRNLPGQRDLNRCFKASSENPVDQTSSGDDAQGQLAAALLQCWQTLRPEALIDIHNTSGAGPSFGVATFMDERHEALISLFSHRMVITDLVLGSVMDLSGRLCPVVTIECGGAGSEESDRTALIGLTQFATLDRVLDLAPDNVVMDFFHHPLRLELLPGAVIDYGTEGLLVPGVNLLPDIEALNFNFVEPGTLLGYFTGELTSVLQARTSQGDNRVEHFFLVDDGCLRSRVRMKFFMVTNNPEIASGDCLLYFVPA